MIRDLELTKRFDELLHKPVYIYGDEKYVEATKKVLKGFGVVPAKVFEWKADTKESELCTLVSDENVIVIIATHFKEYEMPIGLLDYTDACAGDVYTFVGLLYAAYFNLDKAKDDTLNEVLKIWLHNQHLKLNVRQASVNMYPLLMEDKENAPIIIFQPGKVGSNTIEFSLKQTGTQVFRAHGIEYASKYSEDTLTARETFISCIKSFKKVKMITLVREPISKDIGHFFQKLAIEEQDAGWFIKGLMEKDFQKSFLNYLSVVSPFDFTDGKKEQFVEKLICHIDYIGQKNPNGAMWGWFEEELKNNFGIDVLAHDFDTEKGYSIIEKDNIELLVIKLEKLNSLERVIRDFTGVEEFTITSTNRGDAKSYKYIYPQFQKDVLLPRDYVDYYYKDNAYTSHFYSEEERKKFMEKWEKHIV